MKERSDRKQGRPPLNVTEDQRKEIQRLGGFGTPIREIAAIVGISVPTIYKYYREDLTLGKGLTNAKVVNALYEAAIGGNVSAMMYWTKHRCGWKEGENPDDEYEPSKGKIQLITNCMIPVGSATDEHRSPLRGAGGV